MPSGLGTASFSLHNPACLEGCWQLGRALLGAPLNTSTGAVRLGSRSREARSSSAPSARELLRAGAISSWWGRVVGQFWSQDGLTTVSSKAVVLFAAGSHVAMGVQQPADFSPLSLMGNLTSELDSHMYRLLYLMYLTFKKSMPSNYRKGHVFCIQLSLPSYSPLIFILVVSHSG